MNHDDATRYLDALGAATVSRPSVSGLVTAGRSAERRKRRQTVAGTVAVVALILGGGAVIHQATAGVDDKPAPDQLAEPPTAPDGMRLAGMERVVVAVPDAWGSDHGCDRVVVGPAAACQEDVPTTVSFFDPSADQQAVMLDDPATVTYNNVRVTEGSLSCPPTASCVDPRPFVVVVPEEGVGIQLNGRAAEGELRRSIVESLRLLPKGYTTVPYLPSSFANGPAGNVLIDAGLEFEESPAQAGALSGRRQQFGTVPEAGAVVRVASSVVLLLEPGGPPIEGTWTALLSGITADGRLDDLHRDTTFTLTFAGGELRGDDGCNSFGADYSQVGRNLTFGPIESTMIGCETTGVIVGVLNDVRHVTGSAKRLYLHADHWGIVLSLRPASSGSSSSPPRSLTCPTLTRAGAAVPFFDETAPGSTTPEGAVEVWLQGEFGRNFGPEYVMDANKRHAWLLRPDGTAEARVTVKLTAGGGYFYYGHEACG